MKAVRAIVDGKVVFLSVELEMAAANAIAISSDKSRQIRLRRVYYVLNVVVSLYNVGAISVLVRHHQVWDMADMSRLNTPNPTYRAIKFG